MVPRFPLFTSHMLRCLTLLSPRRVAIHVRIFRLACDPTAWVDAGVHAPEPNVADDQEKTSRGPERATQDSELTGRDFHSKERVLSVPTVV